MKDLRFILLIIFISLNAFSQQKTIKHIVAQGESIYEIAKKYDVKQDDIIKLNPKAKGILKLKSVLLIPDFSHKKEKEITLVTHKVLPKETLYGISKQYKVTIDEIKLTNPIIEKEGLEIGLKISIPVGKGYKPEKNTTKEETVPKEKLEIKEKPVVKEIVLKEEPIKQIEPRNPIAISPDEEITHIVLPKETKYGISKQYKISIPELEKLNPEIVNNLPVGYSLIIRKGTKIVSAPVVSPQMEEIETNETATGNSTDTSTPVETPITVVAPLSPENMSKADFLIAKASENLGSPYRSGGTTKNGFDCSGLMFSTFKNIEMTLPRSSPGMAGAGVRIDRSQVQKGDLIFFATMGRRGVSHVGMVVEVLEDEIKFIHSATHSGVIVSSTKETYYAKRFVQVNRVLE